jgi:ADP-ribose pyrophosphatase YjhB (NUDIX family)
MAADEDSREYPERPIIGVGGVVFRGDKVLLVKRAKPPRQGAWSLPGGAQEPGEAAEATFSRELREETGLDVEPAGFIETVDFIEPDDAGAIRHHYTLLDYWAESNKGEAKPGSDVSEVVWTPLNGLGDYDLWDKTLEVIQAAVRLRIEARKAYNRHSFKGHLRTVGIAVIFGLTAYGAIHLLIWILKSLGLMGVA